MEALSKYILSVIAAALILGILKGLSGSGSTGALLRLVGGLFLTFVIIQPVGGFDFSAIGDYLADFSLEGEQTAAHGETIADGEYRSIIKTRVEAYILDKAKTYALDLTAEVTLDDETAVPVEVRLVGKVSPYAKTQLQLMLQEDLGIAKENQLWIG